MADFDNIPIEVSAEDLENVAKRPYKEETRKPTSLDEGVSGQWWIHVDSDTENVVGLYQRVGDDWIKYLDSETEVAGLTLDGGITLEQLKQVLNLNEYVKNTLKIAEIELKSDVSVEDLLTALDVYPLIIGSDPPTTSTRGYAKQLYFDIENSIFYVCRGLVGSGYLWEKAFTTSGGGGSVDLSDYIKKNAIITTIDENVTDEQIPSAKAIKSYVDDIFNTYDNNILAILGGDENVE